MILLGNISTVGCMEVIIMEKIDLRGSWNFCLDKEKLGIEKEYFRLTFDDTIELPNTVSTAKKGTPSDDINLGNLTDPYLYEGYTWYSRLVEFKDLKDKELFLILERTRVSRVWIDEQYLGSRDSLCSSHKYQLTSKVYKDVHRLTILVDNTSYPVKGGHMTSPDTQTNWNGITGSVYVEVLNRIYLDRIKIYPDAAKKLIHIKATLNGAADYKLMASVTDGIKTFPLQEYQLREGENVFCYYLDETAIPWSEHQPKLYTLNLDDKEYTFGLRDFRAENNYFQINGARTFLRGKHDGLVFPLTGHAPMDIESWLKILGIAKQYGINHYRFHTCCPPEAAFCAADKLGIYMEPELPFWGTVTEEGEENHDENAQQYLIEEGYRILDEYGNHPSFVMMSLGNELWGSKSRLNEILGYYKKYDNRHLYTQGSNNFQFMPCILEQEDFFCGVRFSKDRLFRGSYAMCDAPQGHVQTLPPNTNHNYDAIIRPIDVNSKELSGGEITIQYGTGTKKVRMDESYEVISNVPVVSHEIGQYAMYPDFSEINKYTGVLKPRNLIAFQKRLEEKGMLSNADEFFRASGRFAAECYKAEIETAMRSNELAGFQILDLQDFPGQGTALIGILDTFMENKGLILDTEWRQFCSPNVLLVELPKLIYQTGESMCGRIKLASFGEIVIERPAITLLILDNDKLILSDTRELDANYSNGVFSLCDFNIKIPKWNIPKKISLVVRIEDTEILNRYELWVYPTCDLPSINNDIVITKSLNEAISNLELGSKVLFFPDDLNDKNSVEGTYCTDFWCYPMFRSISESVEKPVPVGTHGLFISKSHKIFKYYPTESYTTPQWYDFVVKSRALILDKYDIAPIVWSIDNFERNHRLGNIFEAEVGEGKLFVCTADFSNLQENDSLQWLYKGITSYMASKDFLPKYNIDTNQLKRIFE